MNVHYLQPSHGGHVFAVLNSSGDRIGTYTACGTYLEAREEAEEYAQSCATDIAPERELPFCPKPTPLHLRKAKIK